MAASFIALLLAGVGGVAQVTQTGTEHIQVVPPLNTDRTVGAGEPILTSDRTAVASQSTADIRIRKSIKIGNLMKGQVTIPESSIFVERQGEGKVVACTKLNMAFGRNKPCLIDSDGDGTFDLVTFKSGEQPQPLPEKVEYRRNTTDTVTSVGRTYRVEITYSGSNGTSLSLGYREFVDDMARPAFAEQLTIPLSPSYPQEVRAKGATFRIKSVNGMGLTYSVLDVGPAGRAAAQLVQ